MQMTEAGLSDAIHDVAKTFGWTTAHFGAARTAKGWRTPVRYEGKGFPDLVLVHPERRLVIFRELKAGRNGLRPEQEDWLCRLEAAGADVEVWNDRAWPEIVAYLSGGRAST